MIDYFALLNEPRRPWLDPDSVKKKFLTFSAECHPDRVHSASVSEREAAQKRYTDLNAAYNCLRENKSRLVHLIELEGGSNPKDVQNVPAALMEMFLRVREVCQRADAFLSERSGVDSPLLKVQMFERAQDMTESLAKVRQQINGWHEELVAQLKKIDAAWDGSQRRGNREDALKEIEGIYPLFSYFNRWNGQIQERIAQLSF